MTKRKSSIKLLATLMAGAKCECGVDSYWKYPGRKTVDCEGCGRRYKIKRMVNLYK